MRQQYVLLKHLSLFKFKLNVWLCKLCPDVLCAKPEYHLLFLSDIGKVPENKSYDEPQCFTAAKLIYIRLAILIPQVLKPH